MESNDNEGGETTQEISLPDLVENEIFLKAGWKREFANEQMVEKTLEEIRKKNVRKKSLFVYKDSIIIRKTKNHRGLERKQFVVQAKFRQGIVSACHENTTTHLGVKNER